MLGVRFGFWYAVLEFLQRCGSPWPTCVVLHNTQVSLSKPEMISSDFLTNNLNLHSDQMIMPVEAYLSSQTDLYVTCLCKLVATYEYSVLLRSTSCDHVAILVGRSSLGVAFGHMYKGAVDVCSFSFWPTDWFHFQHSYPTWNLTNIWLYQPSLKNMNGLHQPPHTIG